MFLLTGKVGGAAARHPWRTIAAWLILIVALFGLKTAFGGQYQDNYTVPGAPSQAGADFLQAHFPQISGTDARVVIHDRAATASTRPCSPRCAATWPACPASLWSPRRCCRAAATPR